MRPFDSVKMFLRFNENIQRICYFLHSLHDQNEISVLKLHEYGTLDPSKPCLALLISKNMFTCYETMKQLYRHSTYSN